MSVAVALQAGIYNFMKKTYNIRDNYKNTFLLIVNPY